MSEPAPSAPARETTPGSTPDAGVLPPLRVVAAVALGGMIGAVLRVGLAQAFPVEPGRLPWTTLAENVVGAFLLGLILVLVLERWRPPRDVRPFLCTGVLGSFTTFSNYTVETVALAPGHAWIGLVYALVSIVAGLAAAALGMSLARPGLTGRADDGEATP